MRCPTCGEPVAAGSDVCRACGVGLREDATESERPAALPAGRVHAPPSPPSQLAAHEPARGMHGAPAPPARQGKITPTASEGSPDSDETRLTDLVPRDGDTALPTMAVGTVTPSLPTPRPLSLRQGTRVRTGSRTGPGASEAPTGPLAVGEPFGPRYQILRLLGVGGMGAVYEAWDAELEMALALKVIRPDVTDDPLVAAEIEHRFKRELILARQVTHPNVVRIHDLGEIDGIKYITMPYIEGRDLASVLAERKTLPVPLALNIARQLAAGLSAAHAAGVVHRDLKPANVMIDREDRVVIMDFGIARSERSRAGARSGPGFAAGASADLGATLVGTTLGTIEFMAPEQARGEEVDHRADVYAFGLILRRMLIGKRFAQGTTDALADLSARMQAEPTRLRAVDANLPEAVERIVSRCLQPKPDDRFNTTAELAAALEALDDNGVPLPASPRLLRSVRFWAAAGVLVAALVGGTWWAASRLVAPSTPETRAPVSVLIADFANDTAEPVFNGLLEPSLSVGIEGASFISAYQRPAALRLARQMKAGDRLDESACRLVAMREGIKVVLVGRIERRGQAYAVSVRGVDPTSGALLLTSRVEAANRDGVLAAAGRLAVSVRSGLGDTRAAEPAETWSAASLEAVSAYLKAQELFAAGQDDEAITYYRQATERDPTFARAYGGWATCATRLGRREEADRLWKTALSKLDQMTDRERYRLLGAYYTLVTRNYDKAIETYETLVREYPADGAGHNNLAVGYFRKLDFKRSLEEGRRLLQIYPTSPLYRTNYALYAMYAGDFETATREAQGLVDRKQASFDTYLPLAIAAVARGDLDGATRAYRLMAASGAPGLSLSAVGLADLALYQGRARDAIDLLRRGIARDREARSEAGVTSKQVVLAEALLLQGNAAAAAAAARLALEGDQTEAVVVPAAQILLAARSEAAVAQLASRLDNQLDRQSRAYGRLLAGQVALGKGRRIEAVEAFREAIKLADVWLARFNLGLAFLQAGYFAEALSEFEACQKRRGEASAVFLNDEPTVRHLAPLDYWIGRSRESLGLLPQAQESYRRFTALRATDSPDPLLRDARRRLGAR